MATSDTFTDFCQAWTARFPDSELPAAWEEDVRANLAKHRARTAQLREELDKEEMYVQYLDKLLADIELHRGGKAGEQEAEAGLDLSVTSGSPGSRQQTTDSAQQQTAKNNEQTTADSSDSRQKFLAEQCELHTRPRLTLDLDSLAPALAPSHFVTVISVSSPDGKDPASSSQSLPGLAITDSQSSSESNSLVKEAGRKGHHSTESLGSVSSPLSPSSPVESTPPISPTTGPREAPASPRALLEGGAELLAPSAAPRGRPDGGEEEEESSRTVAALRASWETKPPIAAKPERRSKRGAGPGARQEGGGGSRPGRTDSDSSRGRMGSPSGKSHDSSDSEHSWGRGGAGSPSSGAGRRGREPGEQRLDRLVRRPSAATPPRPAPRPSKEEPLYDTVAADEQQEDEYDNHLLYSRQGRPGKEAEVAGSPALLRRVGAMEEEESNYVNIQYFLQHNAGLNSLDRQESVDESSPVSTTDSPSSASSAAREAERVQMYKHILNSIVESEAIYLECLSVSLQYMKAMRVTLTTTQPVIPKEDFEIIFFKVPELHEFHHHFHESLARQVERWQAGDKVGHHFKMLAQQTKVYAQFLSNYPAALDTLHRCSIQFPQFADLTGSIKLRTLRGQQQGQSLSLEDLLHKPVARVQKNCLSLQDLIKHTPAASPDLPALTESLTSIQNFLTEYNLQHRAELYPGQEPQGNQLTRSRFIGSHTFYNS